MPISELPFTTILSQITSSKLPFAVVILPITTLFILPPLIVTLVESYRLFVASSLAIHADPDQDKTSSMSKLTALTSSNKFKVFNPVRVPVKVGLLKVESLNIVLDNEALSSNIVCKLFI